MTLRIRRVIALLALVVLALPFASGHARAAYSQAELDQMLAPIALYPDPLLSQILMAATRPEEVAEAAQWSTDHRAVAGDAAVQMVQDFDWDPSVKSLVAFPTVLERMGQSPDWTRNLGEAFVAQEPLVMETVQALRQRAQAAGTLISDDRVRIIEEPQAISILPANPQSLYVPYYDPWIAYGSWWWPAYPPFAWDPWPGYYYPYGPYYRSAFWWGPPVGLSLGFFFGSIDWPRRYVRIARTDNYYVRPWIERHRLSATPGRWRPDSWHQRDFARRGTVTQSQTVAPTTQQFSAPQTQQQIPSTRTWRQFSGRTASPQTQNRSQPLAAPTTAAPATAAPATAAPATQQPRRWDEPRRFQSERRSEFRGPESRRPEVRSAPMTVAPRAPAATQAPAMQQAAPARIERAPAPRMERAPAQHVERAAPAPAPRAMERAAPPARFQHSAPPSARADHGPPAHANSREQRPR